MLRILKSKRLDVPLFIGVIILVTFSILILRSIAPFLFPQYYVYIIVGIILLLLFSQIDYEIIELFRGHLYFLSILFLISPLIIGQVTRGAVRWIPLGSFSIQPAEIVRPFLIVFYASFLSVADLKLNRLIKALILLFIPVILILVQPSLGVAILTLISFLGVILASNINKKYIAMGIFAVILSLPLIWQILAPYQKARVTTFINPEADPLGAGYNSLQSMISVGSGKISGYGLGKGVQTQLQFLPEMHTDFIFASVAEELGFVGAITILIFSFFILWRLTVFMESSESPAARSYIMGVFLVLLVQMVINIGMNLGLLPITGLPLPLVSAGGSSFIATMISLGIAMGAVRRS
jgi:rod shape determining protein RodA